MRELRKETETLGQLRLLQILPNQIRNERTPKGDGNNKEYIY